MKLLKKKKVQLLLLLAAAFFAAFLVELVSNRNVLTLPPDEKYRFLRERQSKPSKRQTGCCSGRAVP